MQPGEGESGDSVAPDGRGSAVATVVARSVVLAIVYYVAAKLSLRLALVGESVTPLWPPTGIALAAFLLAGPRVWPGVFVAAFLVNLPISPSPPAAAAIAAGNTVAPLIARRLLQASGFRIELDRLRDALTLVFLGALASMLISAIVGSTSLLVSGAISSGDFLSTWSVWWTGDAMGVLAVTPFLLGLRSIEVRGWPPAGRIVEAALLFVGISFASFAILRTGRPVWVAVFPLLVWAAWRFRQRGAGPAALIVIVMATWSAAHDEGPFASADLLPKMVMLQVFNAAVSITSFFFAAAVAEWERAETERRRLAERDRDAQKYRYDREHRIVETLQRSLLPDRLPDLPDVHAVGRYIPASGDVEIGGDWYDVVALPDGGVGLVVGDIAGHGFAAAASMGQTRTALRAYLLEGLSPARVLERVNLLMRELLPRTMATLACARLDPESGMLTIARAGHPPPAVLSADGKVRYLDGGQGPPVGVASPLAFQEASAELPPGSIFFLYSDGLIERRGESLDRGLGRLREALSGAPDDLDATCDLLLSRLMGTGVSDDVVVLAVSRVSLAGRDLSLALPAVAERLGPMRQVLGRWLRQNGADPGAVAEVLVACSEACANAIQHAYRSKDGTVEIDARTEGGDVVIDVRDFGRWREATSSDDTGRGLHLMRGLMDSVELESDGEGTVVHMRRRARNPVPDD